jgi:replicative DNA helicase
MHDRIQPQNLEAEQIVLGSLLVNASLGLEIFPMLTSQDFYAPANAGIFATMVQLDNAAKPLDKYSVFEALRTAGNDERFGGLSYLSSLMDTVQTASTATYYASLVREKSILRGIIAAAAQIASAGYNGESDVDAAIATAEKALHDAITRSSKKRGHWMGEIAQRIYAQVSAANSGEAKPCVDAPFPVVNARLGGLFGGEFIVIAASPGAGKSSLAMQFAVHSAMTRGPVAVFPLEMGEDDTVRRNVASLADLDIRDMRRGDVRGSQWERFAESISAAGRIPIKLFDADRRLSVADIRRDCRSMENLSLIVVDHPGFLAEAAPSGKLTKHERLESAYIDLRNVAKEMGVPIIVVQHLNRSGMNKKPTLDVLRDGGNIEGVAHTVLFPYRENIDENNPDGELIIAKSRDGKTGSIPMRFNGATFTWEPRSAFSGGRVA